MKNVYLFDHNIIDTVNALKVKNEHNEYSLKVADAFISAVENDRRRYCHVFDNCTAYCQAQKNMDENIRRQNGNFNTLFVSAQKAIVLQLAEDVMIELGIMGVVKLEGYNYELRELVLYCVKEILSALSNAAKYNESLGAYEIN